ncbi:hypothetical protein RclHR1_08720010 [Rhizophagus clarus]|uniref:Protein kinase domain-containing protein n=1 Tax=Rhizophagus clarus TaxID=94130 RepID=A0A2Z6SNV2_9GLOM|nr:hypothetical protein RclHR1_08720010 [Rhizophagus clarus]
MSIRNFITKGYIKFYEYTDFKNVQPIGRGSFGNVVRVNWKTTGHFFALKSFNHDEITLREVVNELKLHQSVDIHENIIRIFGITKEETDEINPLRKYLFVLEYADSGTLNDYLSKHFNELNWKDKNQLALQLTSAVEFIHDYPKSLNDRNYKLNKRSDIYSIGVLMWHISSGYIPFRDVGYDGRLILDILNGKREEIIDGTSVEYSDLYEKCWKYEPVERTDMQEVVLTLKSIITPQQSNANNNVIMNKNNDLRSTNDEIIMDINENLMLSSLRSQNSVQHDLSSISSSNSIQHNLSSISSSNSVQYDLSSILSNTLNDQIVLFRDNIKSDIRKLSQLIAVEIIKNIKEGILFDNGGLIIETIELLCGIFCKFAENSIKYSDYLADFSVGVLGSIDRLPVLTGNSLLVIDECKTLIIELEKIITNIKELCLNIEKYIFEVEKLIQEEFHKKQFVASGIFGPMAALLLGISINVKSKDVEALNDLKEKLELLYKITKSISCYMIEIDHFWGFQKNRIVHLITILESIRINNRLFKVYGSELKIRWKDVILECKTYSQKIREYYTFY